MLKVSLDELQQLLPAAGESELTEGDDLGRGLTFKMVVQKWSEFFKMTKDVHKAHNRLKWEVLAQKCPPIKLVGAGSSRVAYACVGGKCLKIAKEEAGCAQNKQEEKHTMKRWWKRGWDCFVQTYGASKEHAVLLSECVTPMESDEQLYKVMGVASSKVFNAVLWAVVNEDNKFNIAKTAKSLKSKCSEWRMGRGEKVNGMALGKDDIKAVEDAAFWLEAASRKKTPGHRSFLQIVEFWKKNGVEELLPGDVGMGENWGFAIRHGEIAPVMLDVGFSREVADKFY